MFEDRADCDALGGAGVAWHASDLAATRDVQNRVIERTGSVPLNMSCPALTFPINTSDDRFI